MYETKSIEMISKISTKYTKYRIYILPKKWCNFFKKNERESIYIRVQWYLKVWVKGELRWLESYRCKIFNKL